jgi:hypothetical protein
MSKCVRKLFPFDSWVYKELAKQAKREGQSIGDIVNKACFQYVRRQFLRRRAQK